MQNSQQSGIKRIVVAGGGTAGWMTACALVSQMGHCVEVVLVESANIPTVGVGEATIPTMQSFHLLLQLSEQDFIRATNATFKLGIQFENWGEVGKDYFHSFGDTGHEFWAGQFQHYWLRETLSGKHTAYADYSAEAQAAFANKFAITKNPRLGYAYHLDAGLYAQYLRKISESRGVRRIEGDINHVKLSPAGDIESLLLEQGDEIKGDLFIDCTGFRGLLINKALHSGYEDWSDYFLCDRAVAVQTETVQDPVPYTRSIAHESGWQWRIPLQNRVGNGLVFSSKYLSDEQARSLLLSNIEGECINEPRFIGFQPGRRKEIWRKNCVAIGLSSGFIEPLESTSIHLVSSAVIRLMRMIPMGSPKQLEIDEFNRQSRMELEGLRDFILLHYKATGRNDSEFWRYCQAMDIPDSLRTRMEIYRDSGRIYWDSHELFTVNSWNQVLLGQGVMPKHYHPAADHIPDAEFSAMMQNYRKSIAGFVDKMPSHKQFISQYCSTE
ncbi:tryptophan halogenase family protein [Gilvimarinus sp. 1_MG-2023]|uniref:tryptophan halogenase family protein n=1 Tax=Gilvimarinus sp. 1_MG-2023 TaxID=3062638 RepID=UPI0026E19E8D|nr:tryptophan halogenase family protein [Gilvimarinus sp. 1_MG-2023]MDO6746135.1 tryptophan 7-halogenase [Gilvimarinus sp. 1_MG-2023]